MNIPAKGSSVKTSLTLVPPSPVTDQIVVTIRGAVGNHTDKPREYRTAVYLDREDPASLLHRQRLQVAPGRPEGISFRWPTKGHAGKRQIILVVSAGVQQWRAVQPLEVIASNTRSTGRIDGAFAGIYHWSETEGRLWNADIKHMSDHQWRELVRAMHEIGMDVVVIQETVRNQAYVGKHAIEAEGYHGKAFYPSRLHPQRMPVAAKDPVEAILSEADELGMNVFMGAGLYAWFDFTAGSLKWHTRLAEELWQLYGHHPSFYGWYVSEETDGGLVCCDGDATRHPQRQREVVDFFRGFKAYVTARAPDKPVMLATNAHNLRAAREVYPELMKSLDIICPFAFHRMPPGDYTGEEAAAILQKYCDDAGAHLWLDLEVFLFTPDNALYPRPIEGLASDLHRFTNFEKIICYQFPGLMNAPWMTLKPGGPDTVKLFQDYTKFLAGGIRS